MKALVFAAIALLFVLRFDVWNQDDPSFVLGLPIGLTYHVLYCLAAAVALFALVRFAWPDRLDPDDAGDLDPDDAAGDPEELGADETRR